MRTPPTVTPEIVEKTKRTKARMPELEAAVLANAQGINPISWRALAKEQDVGLNTILRIVKEYRRIHKIPANFVQRPGPVKNKAHTSDVSSILDVIDHNSALDPIVRRKMLALIAATSTDNNRLGAISRLEELDRMSGAKIGPPEPQSDEQYAERLGRMLYAAGPQMTQLAINWAAKHKEAEIAVPGVETSPQVP